MDFDAGREDGVDVAVKQVAGEAVGGDAVAQHTAELLVALVNSHLMSHEAQVIRRRQAAGAAADDGDLLAGAGAAGGDGDLARLIDGIALEAADVHRVVDHVAAAVSLAGMLAYVAAGDGHGIVLADELDGIGVAPHADEGDIAGDVHACGAERHAGDGRGERAEAAVLVDVLHKVGAVVLQIGENHLRGFIADGAVGALENGIGRLADEVDGVGGAPSVQHLVQQPLELVEADAAGNALAAGLGEAHGDEAEREVNGTHARGAGGQTARHIAVDMLGVLLALAEAF